MNLVKENGKAYISYEGIKLSFISEEVYELIVSLNVNKVFISRNYRGEYHVFFYKPKEREEEETTGAKGIVWSYDKSLDIDCCEKDMLCLPLPSIRNRQLLDIQLVDIDNIFGFKEVTFKSFEFKIG